MSVLSFPRIYFKGFMQWDPCTFNNNDWQEFQTYDAANAALNWSFLATQAVTPQNPDGITPQNFQTTFRPWAIELLPDNGEEPSGPNGSRVPTEWNMFGTHNVSFVQFGDFTSVITGGSLGYGPPVTVDGLIGAPVAIGGSGSPAKLVDTNPASPWSSQIYFGQLAFGTGSNAISGPRMVRLHSRWVNLNRIYTSDQSLTQPAANVACCFQTCIPFADVAWPPSGFSALGSALQQAAGQSPALGIMVRFTAYVNVYFKNGILNNTTQKPRNFEDLAVALEAAWDEYNSTGNTSLFFSNPCYSHIVGTVGVWNEGEVVSAPVGRFLAASSLVLGSLPLAKSGDAGTPSALSEATAPAAITSAEHYTVPTKQIGAFAATASADSRARPVVPLGPLVATIDYGNELISLDLNSTMPENGPMGVFPSDLIKTPFGPLDLGVVDEQGVFSSIYLIPYDQYAQGPYEASAGIIDIPFSLTSSPSNTASMLQNGTMAIQVQGQTALLEELLSAQTDSRGLYVDQGAGTEFEIAVYNLGVPSPYTTVMVAQYDFTLSLIPTNGSPIITFTNGQQMTVTGSDGQRPTNVTVVTSDENGLATVTIAWTAPGFAELAFYPYAGGLLPAPQISLGGQTMNGSFTNAYYTTVRALPADNAVPQQFVDLWSSTGGDQTQAWNFIYTNILYVYDMLFSVMLEFVNLGSQSEFASSIVPIWFAIAAENAVEGTTAMPITRDLSAGKRQTLQLWIYLIANNYQVSDFNVNSIPDGWTPSS
jgi:hypothetical protein